jgi:plastocyanin domain-containing protein
MNIQWFKPIGPLMIAIDRPGRYEFSCGMNMFRGVVEVQA